MEFNKCSRCGNFYSSNDIVCPKCLSKDKLEYSNFVNYVEENGFDNSLNTISNEINISVKNLTRFTEYDGFKDLIK